MIKYISKITALFFLLFQGSIMATPFSFSMPEQVTNLTLRKPQYLKGSDDIKLAYYEFVPVSSEAIMIFYHGAGIWSTRMYQYMARQLADNHNIGTYLFDIRGHGNSQGPRGDAPSSEQVWQDISSAIDFVHKKHPSCKIVLGGHSSGAGLALNYSNWQERKDVAGYVLLAPFLGGQSGVSYEHTDPEKQFAKDVRLFPLIVNAITGGLFFEHTPVIYFNYPEQEKQKDAHILESYTCTMSKATGPYDAKEVFTELDKPFLMLIGSSDEQFIPEKVVDFGQYAKLVNDRSMSQIVPGATHLGLVIEAPAIIAQALPKMLLTLSN